MDETAIKRACKRVGVPAELVGFFVIYLPQVVEADKAIAHEAKEAEKAAKKEGA